MKLQQLVSSFPQTESRRAVISGITLRTLKLFCNFNYDGYIDIATHIISSLHLQKPDTARSSFAVLSSHKIITNELAHGLALAVSFRNLAVHGYDQFDFKQLFYDYKKDITDIKEFVGQILFFLKNHKEDGNQ